MWKIHNGKLIQTTDESRIRYKTRMSAAIINSLKQLAEKYDTHIGYLLENGYSNLIESGTIVYDKKTGLKTASNFGRHAIRNYWIAWKEFAKDHNPNLNDVIEASVAYINYEDVKHANWRYRVEV